MTHCVMAQKFQSGKTKSSAGGALHMHSKMVLKKKTPYILCCMNYPTEKQEMHKQWTNTTKTNKHGYLGVKGEKQPEDAGGGEVSNSSFARFDFWIV